MTVSIGGRFEKMVGDLISSGRFQNQSEVIRAGLRLLEDAEYGYDEALERELAKRLERSSKPLNKKLFEGIKKRGRERLKRERVDEAA